MRDQLVEQELVYEKLPKDIADRHVLLMDPILATGNSAARAIQASLSTTNKTLSGQCSGSMHGCAARHSCALIRQVHMSEFLLTEHSQQEDKACLCAELSCEGG